MSERIEEPLPEIQKGYDSEHIEAEVLKLRKDLKIYNTLQVRLMILKYGSKDALQDEKNRDDWEYGESAHFEEAFYEIVRNMMTNDPGFIDKLKQVDEHLISAFAERIQLLHKLESQLYLHLSIENKEDAPSEKWRFEYNKKLMQIVHTHPELMDEYMRTEDTAPDEQLEVLKKFEALLYTL